MTSKFAQEHERCVCCEISETNLIRTICERDASAFTRYLMRPCIRSKGGRNSLGTLLLSQSRVKSLSSLSNWRPGFIPVCPRVELTLTFCVAHCKGVISSAVHLELRLHWHFVFCLFFNLNINRLHFTIELCFTAKIVLSVFVHPTKGFRKGNALNLNTLRTLQGCLDAAALSISIHIRCMANQTSKFHLNHRLERTSPWRSLQTRFRRSIADCLLGNDSAVEVGSFDRLLAAPFV